jgi:hypothetical protein
MTFLLEPDEYKREFGALMERYGSASKLPSEQVYLLSERLRAFYVTQLPEFSVPSLWAAGFKAYNIMQSLWVDMPEVVDVAKKRAKHADKNKALKVWAETHIGVMVKVDELAEECGVSTSKARSFIYDRVDIFTKAGHGLFLVKDPKAEREAEKQR